MPEYPLDPRKEMSEGEYMGHTEDAYPDWSGSLRTNVPDEPSAQAIENAQPEWVPEFDELFDELSLERAFRSRGYRIISGPGDKVGKPIPVHSDPYVEMYRKMYGDEVLIAGMSLLHRLRGDVWKTQDEQKLTVAEMTPSHASNLKAWLERRARVILIAAQLEAGCAAADHDGGMHAHDAIEAEHDELLETEPLDHLRRLKLYKAICERATEVFVRG